MRFRWNNLAQLLGNLFVHHAYVSASSGVLTAEGIVDSLVDDSPWQACKQTLVSLSHVIDQWSDAACPREQTCCPSVFSENGIGCCPEAEAVCCPDGRSCCPAGTECNEITRHLFNYTGFHFSVYNCTDPTTRKNTTGHAVCKPGPPMRLEGKKKNVLWIGDSLSIGMTYRLKEVLAEWALVQHSPWDRRDGGAEETAYGVQCLRNFLRSPSGDSLLPSNSSHDNSISPGLDMILFNWGMHNGPLSNRTVPGQTATPDSYEKEVTMLVDALVEFASKAAPSKPMILVFLTTTPFLCNSVNNGCVMNLNNIARAVIGRKIQSMWKANMKAVAVADSTEKSSNSPFVELHLLDIYTPVVSECPVPSNSCFGEEESFCPHSGGLGYKYLVDNVIAPEVTRRLKMK